jgi:hypothetical protein
MLALWLACAPVMEFDPPSDPPHNVREDGYRHARGHENPFLCGGQTCPEDGSWPTEQNMSCDGYGCHGGNAYDGVAEERHLRGSDGPSCWTCHDQEWSSRKSR